jgi:arsenate reductase-like glutaredoxin family protein
LGTNVSDESESVWAKRMAKNYIQEHARHYRDDSVSENEIKAFLKQAKQEFEDSFNNPEEIGE